MAADHSMDIVVRFDLQELRNAVDQCRRDASTRYDLKDAKIEIELNADDIKFNAETENQLEAVFNILIEKITRRGLSYKILDRKPPEQAGGMRMRQEIKLIKALDQENAKMISKFTRDHFPKAKANIQGDTVRIVSKSIDELQQIMAAIKAEKTIDLPLEFTNYR